MIFFSVIKFILLDLSSNIVAAVIKILISLRDFIFFNLFLPCPSSGEKKERK
jgi:hypothetical protein